MAVVRNPQTTIMNFINPYPSAMKDSDLKVKMFLSGDHYCSSSYYRGYEVARVLRQHNIRVAIRPSYIPTYPLRKPFLRRVIYHLINIIRKIWEIITTSQKEIIFIQRYIDYYSSPFLIIIAKKIFRRRIIFDMDDEIFTLEKSGGIRNRWDWWSGRITLSLSDVIIIGSHYLERYATAYHRNAILIPTAVNLSRVATESREGVARIRRESINPIPVIGWVGTVTALRYLSILTDPLAALARKYQFEFRIITTPEAAGLIPEFKNVRVKIIPWTRGNEWLKIEEFDIGVMPLFNRSWEEGKCAFKAIQYMAVGVPAVCSAVGECRFLIQDGINGFLAASTQEWVSRLEQLLLDRSLQLRLGQAGYETVRNQYSLDTNILKVVDVLLKNQNAY